MTPEEFYARYPSMKPYEGQHYEAGGRPRLLLVGESHYLPEQATQHLDAATWYQGSQETLAAEELRCTGAQGEWRRWIDTAGAVSRACATNFANKAHWIWKNAFEVINEAGPGYPMARDVADDVAIFNFFLRPAREHDSLRGHLTEQDIDLANVLFEHRIADLQPRAIAFVSRLAAKKCQLLERLEMPIVVTCHPSSAWWNRRSDKYEGRCGREILAAFVRDRVRWREPVGDAH